MVLLHMLALRLRRRGHVEPSTLASQSSSAWLRRGRGCSRPHFLHRRPKHLGGGQGCRRPDATTAADVIVALVAAPTPPFRTVNQQSRGCSERWVLCPSAERQAGAASR